MFRFSSLLLLSVVALASSDQGPLQADPLLSSRSRSSKTSDKVLVVNTNVDGTICTGFGKKDLPKGSYGHVYFYVKDSNGDKIKIKIGTTNSTPGEGGWWANFKTTSGGTCSTSYADLLPIETGTGECAQFDRSECCKYKSNISPGINKLGQPCTPSKEGERFSPATRNSTCEPACRTVGKCDGDPDETEKIASCEECSKGSLQIGNSDSTNAASELDVEEGDYLKVYFKTKSRRHRRGGSRSRHRSPESDVGEEGEVEVLDEEWDDEWDSEEDEEFSEVDIEDEK